MSSSARDSARLLTLLVPDREARLVKAERSARGLFAFTLDLGSTDETAAQIAGLADTGTEPRHLALLARQLTAL
jgi:hypothetical protein